jgi:predicted transcriptional regulator
MLVLNPKQYGVRFRSEIEQCISILHIIAHLKHFQSTRIQQSANLTFVKFKELIFKLEKAGFIEKRSGFTPHGTVIKHEYHITAKGSDVLAAYMNFRNLFDRGVN